jgi:hypothetical protein
MRWGTVDALARQLVTFDARIAEEIAEHLVARAERLEAQRGADDVSVAARAGSFRGLAKLIQLELAFDAGREGPGPTVARLPVVGQRGFW